MTDDTDDTYNANIRVRGLPRKIDDILNEMASKQGRPKWEVVRDALIDYATHWDQEGRPL